MRLLILGFLLLLSSISFAQKTSTRPVCGTMEHLQWMMQQDPNYEQNLQKIEKFTESYIQNQQLKNPNQKQLPPIYTIPVVFHVLFQNATENIPTLRLTEQIAVLNQDYRRTNTDAGNTPAVFQPIAADCEIEFCLAQRDPAGASSTGIIRKATTVASFTTDNGVKFNASGGDNAWPCGDYLNIWVCDLGGGLLGYAQFPGGACNTDGVVLNYRYVGVTGALVPFDLGRTATHEVGHYLNLRHIWGDAACGSDLVGDTPTAEDKHFGCPVHPLHVNMCGGGTSPNGEMFMNYMDYTDDGCMNMYSTGQRTRQRALFAAGGARISLTTSQGCVPPTALDAGIVAIVSPTGTLCATSIQPVVTLKNFGSTTLTTVQIKYQLDGGAVNNFNWAGTLISGSSVNVTLPSMAVTAGAHTFTSFTNLPNGSADQNTTNDQSVSSFTVTTPPVGTPVPFWQSFNLATFPPTGWTLDNGGNTSFTWARTTLASGFDTSTASTRMDNFSSNTSIAGDVDALVTPSISFASVSAPVRLDFSVAYARFDAANFDRLKVYYSTNCGGNWIPTTYDKAGTVLATAPDQTTAFVPSPTQWRRESINIDLLAGNSNVVFRFENISGWGNYLYLDDINLYGTSAVSPPVANFSASQILICQGQTITFTDLSTNTPTSWAWTLNGGTPATSTLQNPAVTFNTPGTYTISLTATNGGGSDSEVKTNYITVNQSATANAGADSVICAGNTTVLAGTIGGSATSATWTTSGTGTFSNSTSLTATYTSSAADIAAASITLTLTTNDPAGPCLAATDQVVITINPAATANAGADTIICAGSTHTLSGSIGGSATSATWATSGTGTFNNSSSLTATYTPSTADITAGTVTLTLTTNNPAGPCNAATDVLLITINPAATANAGTDAVICAGSTDTLSGSIGGSATSATWTTSGTGTFSNPASLTAIYTPSAADVTTGSVTLTLTTDNPAGPCPAATDLMIITINPQATVNAGIDATICAGSTFTLAGVIGGSATSATWSSSGTGTFNNVNSLTAIYTPSAADITAGTVTLTLTTNNPTGPCNAVSDAMAITINAAATANAGADTSVCAGSAHTLSGTISGSASSATWTTSGTGTFSNTASLTATYTPSAADITMGSATLTLTTNDPVGPCTPASDAMILAINAQATTNAGPDATICSGNTHTITGATFGGGASSVTWTTSGGGTFNNPSLVNPTYTPSAADITSGTITLTITTNDPAGPCPSASDFMLLIINPNATANAGIDSAICAGSSYTLSGSIGGTATNATWTTSGTGIFSSSTSLTAIYTPSAADNTMGSSTITLTTNDPAGPCPAATDQMIITINPQATANAGADTAICAGSTHTLAGVIGGGASSATWTTSGTGTFNNATSLTATYTPSSADITAGNITLILTTNDPAGPCPAVSDAMVFTINTAPTANAGADAAICAGSAHTLSGTIGGSATSASWTTSGTGTFSSSTSLTATYTPSAADITTGSVTLLLTTNDPAGPCTPASDPMVLTVNSQATVNAGPDATICSGNTHTFTGATFGGGASSVTWATSGSGAFNNPSLLNPVYTPSAADITSGTVNLTVTTNDPAGPCVAAADFMVLIINPPATANAGADSAICSGSTYTLSGSIGGSATSASWTTSGTGTFSSPTSLTATYTPSAADITTGSVSLTLTTNDPVGPCTPVADTMILTINAAAIVNAGIDTIVCSGSSYTLSGSIGGSATSATWTTSGSGSFSNSTSLTATYTPSAADIATGSVTLTLTTNDPVGSCTAVSDSMILAVNPALSISSTQTNVSCNGGSDGSAAAAAAGGSSPYSYLWNDPAPAQSTATVTGLAAATWTVTATDNKGCATIATVTITQPTALTVSTIPTNVSCNGGSDGSATAAAAGGSSPYSFIWNDPAPAQLTATATGLTAATWTVTATDNKGCVTTTTATITQPTALTVSTTQTNVSCNGGSDGSATAAAAGGSSPYSYIWNDPLPAQSTATVTGLTAGTWTVTVTDSKGCTTTTTVSITQSTALTVSTTQTNVSCNGGSNGSATATGANGTSPFTYVWNDPAPAQSTATVTGLTAATWTVTVTDNKGCTTTTTVTITQPAIITLTISKTDVSCNGGTNGTASVAVSGGVGSYSYLWTGGMTTASIIGLTSGTNTVSVTDGNGCTKTDSATINQPAALSVLMSGVNVTCNGLCNGQATASASGGTSPYSYSWDDPGFQTNSTATGLCAGTFNVTITDTKGCTVTGSRTVTQPIAFTLSMATSNANCNTANGSAEVSESGGGGPFTYLWNDPAPAQTTNTATGLFSGVYSVTVTNASGCTKTATATVNDAGAPTVTIGATTNVNCNGTCTGASQVSASGGVTPYSYIWSNGATTTNATALCAATYSVTVQDSVACMGTAIVTITQPTALIASISSTTNVSCNGGSNGSATVSESGGTSPYTYLWNDPAPAQTTSTVTGLTGGNWTVTLTDSKGCTTTATATISQPIALTVSTTKTDVSCFGGNTGTAAAAAAGGSSPYTYIWNDPAPAQLTATVTGLTAATWTVTATDNKGCTATASVTITQPGAVLSVSTTQTNISCNGGNNGTATAVAAGGSSSYTYIWNDPAPAQSTATVTGLTAATWTVTVTDNNNCTTSASVTIIQPALLTVSAIPTNVSCNGGNDGSATAVAAGGSSPYTYIWNDPAPAQSTATVTGLTAATWTVTATDNMGCATTVTVAITQPAILTLSTVQTNVSCNGDSNGTATATGAGGTSPYSYIWNDPAPVQSTATATGFSAGTWTVTVTDNNGCATTSTVTITQPLSALTLSTVQTNVSCNGGSDGSATAAAAGGSSPYSYIWNDPVPAQSTATVTGLTAGTWTVTVTDSKSCTTTTTVSITQSTALTVSTTQTNVSCNGGSNGSAAAATAGGSSPYSYLWNDPAPAQSTATVTGLTAATWTVTVTDTMNCITTVSVTITQPAVLTVSVTQTNVSCNGGNDGTATVAVAGGSSPFTYIWNDPVPVQSTATVTGLTAATWAVTATDNNGCTAATTVTITQPTALSVTTTQTNVSCNGGSDGTAAAAVAGGSSPYTYLWNDPAPAQSTATITGLSAATWTVTATDNKGCTTTTTVTITQPAALSLSASATNSSCTSNNGSATVTASGGTSPFAYLWSASASSQTTSTATGLGGGTYAVTVTDNKGCTQTISVTVNSSTLSVSIGNIVNILCNGVCSGDATATVSGGNTPYSFLWSNGETTSTATALCGGNQTVTVTDSSGCVFTGNVSIAQPSAILITSSKTDVNCNGQSTGSASVTVTGGTPSYSYLWNNGSVIQNISSLPANTYFITVTDSNSCTKVSSVDIIQPAPISLSTSATNATCGSNNGSATVTATGGKSPYTYLWNSSALNQTTATATGLNSGTYTVTVTDGKGCTSSSTVFVNNNIPQVNIASSSNITCQGICNGTVTTNLTGGVSPYTYMWSNGTTTANATGLCAGSASVTVTDGNGCNTSAAVTLTAPPALSGTFSVVSPVSCFSASNGSLSVTVSGGFSPYTYSWNNGQSSSTTTGLNSGNYTVSVTDANSCSKSFTYTLTQPSQITLSGSSVNAKCGTPDGSATVAAAGGSSPYIYIWDDASNQTTAMATGLSAGTYHVTVKDTNGCSALATIQVNNDLPIIVLASSNATTCWNKCDGKASVNASGGVLPYTYLWDNGEASSAATALCPGQHVVTVIDSNSCVSTFNVTIGSPDTIVIAFTSVINITCNGLSNGSITSAVNGGTSPYSFLWNDPAPVQTTVTATGLAAGNYSVLVTDSNGCTKSSAQVITQPPLLSVSVSVVNASCGSSNGSATANPSGGTTPYIYQWNGGQTTKTLSGLSAGSYSVQVTDFNGCTSSANTAVFNNNLISTISSFSNASCAGVCNGTATVTITTGAGPFTYNWDNGDKSSTADSLCAGIHSVTVTDVNSCTTTDTITTGTSVILSISAAAVSNVTCAGLSNGNITVNVTGGSFPYSYLWNDSLQQTSVTATGLKGGTYQVTSTDGNGCTILFSQVISEPPVISLTLSTTDATCGLGNGTATASATGGTSPYSYLWNDSAAASTASVTGLSSGSYSVTLTDGNLCTKTGLIFVNNNIPIINSLTSNNVNCFGACNGIATVTASNGATPYTYSWSNGVTSSSVTTLCAGNYTITITDANGCIKTSGVLITQPAQLNAALFGKSDVKCGGKADGSATVIASGGVTPYTYTWSTQPISQTTATATGLSGGVYSVTVTDGNSCTATLSITIAEPPVFQSILTPKNISCAGASNGSIDATVSGGVLPYTISWSTGDTTQDIYNLSAGLYVLTVIDSNNCKETDSVVITSPASAIAISINTTAISCGDSANGAIDITVTGGTQPYTYTWSNGDTIQDLIGLSSGAYSVLVLDINGCTMFASDTVKTTAPITLGFTTTNITCFGKNDGAATVIPSGGVSPFSYLWNIIPPQTTLSITGLKPAKYDVTVTDLKGCIKKSSVFVSEPEVLSASVYQTPADCKGICNGKSIVVTKGGTGNYTYLWDAGAANQTTSIATGLCEGSYIISISDANNCKLTKIADVGITSQIKATPSVTKTTCIDNSDGKINISLQGGTSPFQYSWNNGSTTKDISALVKGVYVLTVKDSKSCTSVDSIEVGTGDGACFIIYDAFTPNDDGANDVWNIKGIEKYTNAGVEVYNRWGSLVFNSKPYSKPWDGKFEGKDVPEGIYYYIVTIPEKEQLTGTLTIAR